ncbi:MAG: gamma-glutamyltransferase [Alphaproteobacteria bacterium]|nr:gamma-glutamyltransferase [Alphaproteobacteria bacterium]MCW5739395.1 gamma-glutamyltransferase [Alphaproteobacteria bacterium]
MRFGTIDGPSPLAKANHTILAAAALAALLGGCSGDKPVRGDVGFIEGFFGAVVADEPRAADAGRDVLTSGGSAADAAVAMYFTMAATLPSAASLGAGGVCLVHNASRRSVESIVFPPVPVSGSARGYDIAVPMAARGMALLHARHGRSRWELLVAGGERVARFGAPVSRALSRDLQAGARLIGADPEARRIYDKGGGVAVTEGDVFHQGDLGATLGIIKARGGGDLYQGPLARQLSGAVQQAGGNLTLAHLRAAVPRVVPPLQVRFGDHTAFFAPAPFDGGQSAASAFQSGGSGGGTFEGGEAGFVAVDRDANAVSCVFTMNQLFGARRVAPGTGIMLGAPSGNGMAQTTPMLVSNVNNGEFLLAGAASGGPGAPAALGAAARTVLSTHGRLADAVGGTSGGVLSIFTCSRGLKFDRRTCQALADPRGHGLALIADR